MSATNFAESIRSSWGWLLAMGISYVVIGCVTLGYPMASTIAVELLVAMVLFVGGIVSIVGAFFSGNWKRFILILLSGILYLVVGFFLLKNPLAGVVTLTLLLAAFLLVEGFFKIINALQIKPAENWSWIFISGVASVILGIMIWAEFPASSAFILGLLIGIYLLINGVSLIMFSLSLKNNSSESA